MYVKILREHTQFLKNFGGIDWHVMCYVVPMYLVLDQRIDSIL